MFKALILEARDDGAGWQPFVDQDAPEHTGACNIDLAVLPRAGEFLVMPTHREQGLRVVGVRHTPRRAPGPHVVEIYCVRSEITVPQRS